MRSEGQELLHKGNVIIYNGFAMIDELGKFCLDKNLQNHLEVQTS